MLYIFPALGRCLSMAPTLATHSPSLPWGRPGSAWRSASAGPPPAPRRCSVASGCAGPKISYFFLTFLLNPAQTAIATQPQPQKRTQDGPYFWKYIYQPCLSHFLIELNPKLNCRFRFMYRWRSGCRCKQRCRCRCRCTTSKMTQNKQ